MVLEGMRMRGGTLIMCSGSLAGVIFTCRGISSVGNEYCYFLKSGTIRKIRNHNTDIEGVHMRCPNFTPSKL